MSEKKITHPPREARNRWSDDRILGALALALLAFCAYIPALSAGYIWDDPEYITGNEELRSLKGLWNIWFVPGSTIQYYPLVFTSFWIEHHLWGSKPFGYHLNNVLLHVLNCLLLWHLLKKMRVPGAWLAAAIFAVHPVHVASVAWATERKDVLSGALFFMTLIAWRENHERPSWKWYSAALTLYALMLLAKAATVPTAAILLLLLWWWKGRLGWRDIILSIPFFLLSGAMSLLHVIGEQKILSLMPKQVFVGPPLERILVAGRALWFYSGKLLIPSPLMAIYPRWEMKSSNPLDFLWVVAATIVPVVLFALRSRIGRGPFTAAAFFGLMLSPALGFFSGGFFRLSFVSDHFQYLASAGLITLAVGLITWTTTRLSLRIYRTALLAAGSILAIFCILTWQRCETYQQSGKLFRHDLQINPNSWYALFGVGADLSLSGRNEEALPYLARAAELKPEAYDVRIQLATVLVTLGRYKDAIEQNRAVVRINPALPQSYINLTQSYDALGDLENALAAAEYAVLYGPNLAKAHYNQGVVLQKVGRNSEAIAAYQKALKLNPNMKEAAENLGVALSS